MNDKERDALVVSRLIAEIGAASAALALERHDLEQEQGYLKRRIAEEDERLSHA